MSSVVSSIYQTEDYREYLVQRLDSPEWGRGARQKLAQFIQCQPSFVSQVLSGRNDLSLEQAYRINQFLNHSSEASEYFFLMVQLSKAGTFELQKYFREKMRDLRDKQLQIHQVVQKAELHRDDLQYYYSNWLVISIHMMAAIPKFQDPKLLQEHLKASDLDFKDAVHFLTRTGLINVRAGRFEVGEAHVHLKKTSPIAHSAIVLTRLKVLEKLKLSNPRNINFSSNFTISRRAYDLLRQRILDFISELDEHIQMDDPEQFCTLVLDLLEH